MRNITDHIVNGDIMCNQVSITVTDSPGAGGANHAYHADWPDNNSWDNSKPNSLDIHFQEGPIKEFGVNGVTQEVLLAIVIDRLKSFQAGPFACEANARALGNCQSALNELQQRTRDRIRRGVEGRTQQ